MELLGAQTAAADAEVIGTARMALRAAGVARLRIVLGHVGIVRGFLGGLALDERVREWLIWSMERLHPDDPRGERIHPALAAMLADDDRDPVAEAITPPDRDVFLQLLREAGISLEGNRRTPEEIADGLIRKVRRRAEGNDVRRALAFLRQIVMLRGAPETVLPALEALLVREGSTLPLSSVCARSWTSCRHTALIRPRSSLISVLGAGCTITPVSSSRFTRMGRSNSAAVGATTISPPSSARARPCRRSVFP